MKTKFSFIRTVTAGISGTVIMTLFTYIGGLMNIKMNIPAMLASMFGGNIFIGWIMHFFIGIVLAFGYTLVFRDKINFKNELFLGAVYGIIPWLMAQVIVMPMMSLMNGMSFAEGLFSGSAMLAAASFVGHLIYGAIVGIVYKQPEEKLKIVKA